MTGHPALLHPYARPGAGSEAYIRIVRGEGALVWDDLGNRYVDGLASLWYCNVGHGRAEVIDAITAQLHRLDAYNVFDRFTNEPAEQLAARLAAIAPMRDARVFLASGGSEAVETAMKLARLAHVQAGQPDRTLIVSRAPSYHGVGYGGTTATGLPLNRAGFGPLLPDVVHVPHDDLGALDDVLAEHGHRLAAVIAEPVIGAGGVLPPAPGYLAGLRERCDRLGAFLILDEVICAFQRLGAWWGAVHYGVEPDLVTFAKGVTSGYQPVGGVLVGPRVREPLESDGAFMLRHGYTYSGHPTACAAALANLDVIERDGLGTRARAIGDRLGPALASLVDGDRIAEARGDVAIWAVRLADGVAAVEVREAMLDRGVIARPLGADVIAFCPPLVIADDEIDQCVTALAEAVQAARP